MHASFAGVVVTILDSGNTFASATAGPGIPDKEAALRPGFTSADAEARRSSSAESDRASPSSPRYSPASTDI